jgi:predicted site-specific integrase-resolvase
VSSPEKKGDLERQATRCVEFCQARGWTVERVVKEVASGMNDSRPKLVKLLRDKPARLVVEHKDRLMRFGFGYFELLLPMLDCELVVINREAEERDDLLKDLVAVITSFCCRLYGLRRGQRKALEVKRLLCDAQPE